MVVQDQNQKAKEKQGLRKAFLQQRALIGPAYAINAAKQVTEFFLATFPVSSSSIVGIYYPIQHEIDCKFLAEKVWEKGGMVVLPTISTHDETLYYRQWQPHHALEAGPVYPIPQPSMQALAVGPNLLVVPMVAYDKEGYRLGFGAGLYDRTIESLRKKDPQLPVVGLAYACQQSAVPLPREIHDQKLNYIITEKGVIRIT